MRLVIQDVEVVLLLRVEVNALHVRHLVVAGGGTRDRHRAIILEPVLVRVVVELPWGLLLIVSLPAHAIGVLVGGVAPVNARINTPTKHNVAVTHTNSTVSCVGVCLEARVLAYSGHATVVVSRRPRLHNTSVLHR